MRLLIALATIVGVFFVYNAVVRESVAFNYKLFLRVEVDGRPVEAASVYRVELYQGAKVPIPDGMGHLLSMSGSKCYGQAIPIRIKSSQYVFALNNSGDDNRDYICNLALLTLKVGNPVVRNSSGSGLDLISALKKVRSDRSVYAIKKERFPSFVSVSDTENPLSISRLDLGSPSQALGATVTAKSLHLQLTDEPVRYTIKTIMPWLMTEVGAHLGSGKYRFVSSGAIIRDDFIRE
jgi:hypothetical protein